MTDEGTTVYERMQERKERSKEREQLQVQRQRKHLALAIFAVLAINAWASVIQTALDRAELVEEACGEEPDRSWSSSLTISVYQDCKSDMEIYFIQYGIDSYFTTITSAVMYSLAALYFYGSFASSDEEETSAV